VGGVCKNTCSPDTDCDQANGYSCISGACGKLKSNGQACASGLGSECSSGNCVGKVCCEGTCTGCPATAGLQYAGTCATGTGKCATTDCNTGTLCVGGVCKNTCSPDTDCDQANGYSCISGACGKKKGLGQQCGTGVECTSNNCVNDGSGGSVCCASTCAGCADGTSIYTGACSAVDGSCTTSLCSLCALGVCTL
jgi:hypothetical protein